MLLFNALNNCPVCWQTLLKNEMSQSYILKLNAHVEKAYKNSTVYPPESNLFNSLSSSPLKEVKVIIVGQDPYHGEGQANGLAFSVREGVKLPPSLKNIFKELQADVGVDLGVNGDLSHWAKQGVLLLNTTLTVEQKKPGSHRLFGWSTFTDKVLQLASRELDHVVFILWGSDAHQKEKLLMQKNHLVIKAPHPSPLSSYRGFFGEKYFSRANKFLKINGRGEINWARGLNNQKGD